MTPQITIAVTGTATVKSGRDTVLLSAETVRALVRAHHAKESTGVAQTVQAGRVLVVRG